ncbi:hypothetical protein F4813DRAFT_285003 [Daldinia decipiens]|uniref:uncharacterized protein n=1 Tax=Daldinia decipiens TaxID=326647 RepID=UPI0020C56075|nr:uncharacterized protein F4813DRAFT_285003 [Daldinia decipiens]KAI1653069.1 hypothetical protein F4813DRAFT_285003 [Daldinia decipiens]
MKSFTVATIAAALVSSAAALPKEPSFAKVNLVAINRPISGEWSEKRVTVDLATLSHQENLPITGLAIESVYITAPPAPGLSAIGVADITCQRYKDQFGVQRGSAAFTSSVNASISTNSVDFGYVLCYANPTA